MKRTQPSEGSKARAASAAGLHVPVGLDQGDLSLFTTLRFPVLHANDEFTPRGFALVVDLLEHIAIVDFARPWFQATGVIALLPFA